MDIESLTKRVAELEIENAKLEKYNNVLESKLEDADESSEATIDYWYQKATEYLKTISNLKQNRRKKAKHIKKLKKEIEAWENTFRERERLSEKIKQQEQTMVGFGQFQMIMLDAVNKLSEEMKSQKKTPEEKTRLNTIIESINIKIAEHIATANTK